jgi:hypothetical protein
VEAVLGYLPIEHDYKAHRRITHVYGGVLAVQLQEEGGEAA